MHLIPPMTRAARRLAADRSARPLVLGVGLWMVETANLSLANLRISQIALNLADNASRVGLMSSLATTQVREVDMNDVIAAARIQGAPWDLTTRGRITISSLEADSSGNQVIHWQRCVGLKSGTFYTDKNGKTVSYDSNYGTTSATAGTDTSSGNAGTAQAGGMGDSGAKVTAPPSSGVMFIEVNYDYKPIVSSLWVAGGSAKLHYLASFIVRDRRDFAQIYNPAPTATRSTCDKYTS